MNLSKPRAQRMPGWRALLWGMALLGGLMLRGAPDPEPEWRGDGLCRFLLEGYTLPPATEAQINKVVSEALAEHQRVFGFRAAPDFRVRIRIFGKYEDYEQFILAGRGGRRIAENFPNLTNLSGYYSHGRREIVTWRQQQPGYLANNLLHEASHAILFAHYRRIPTWLSEGCATYFAYPRHMQDANDVGSLKYQWAKLTLWLREQKLPELKTFVDLNDKEWHQLDLPLAYTVSWSVFQLLMSTPENRRVMLAMLGELQAGRGPDMPCASLLEQLYPGGLEQLQQDWRHWILRIGTKVLGPDREQLLKRAQ